MTTDTLSPPEVAPVKANGHYTITEPDYQAVLPAVTTILNVINKPFLLFWYGKHGTEKCNQIKQEAADFGKSFHDILHQIIQGKDVDLTNADTIIQQLVASMREWMRLVNFELLYAERTVYSKTYEYAGTLDCVAKIYGQVALIDWKTSNDLYPEMTLQLAAYDQAVRELGLASPSLALIMRLDKQTGRCHPHTVALSPATFQAFLDAKGLWSWLQGAEVPAANGRKARRA